MVPSASLIDQSFGLELLMDGEAQREMKIVLTIMIQNGGH